MYFFFKFDFFQRAITLISRTFDLELNFRVVSRARLTCRTISLRIPSSKSFLGSTLMIPTRVDFMAIIPSVNMEIVWVNLEQRKFVR